jgi:hypothetical protein
MSGSASIARTSYPSLARSLARVPERVVFPTPPFPVIAIFIRIPPEADYKSNGIFLLGYNHQTVYTYSFVLVLKVSYVPEVHLQVTSVLASLTVYQLSCISVLRHNSLAVYLF